MAKEWEQGTVPGLEEEEVMKRAADEPGDEANVVVGADVGGDR